MSRSAPAWLLALGAALAAGCHPPRRPLASSPDCVDPGRINPQGICTMEYEPVCGCNGRTYSNACVARKAGVRDFRPGPCPTRP